MTEAFTMTTFSLLLTMFPSMIVAQLQTFPGGLPKLTQEELAPPNHIVVPKRDQSFSEREVFVVREPIAVGDILGVILPVQQGVAFRWKRESSPRQDERNASERAFRWLNPNDGKADLREMREDFGFLATGPLGRADALQIFRFQAIAPVQNIILRFRLVGFDGQPSERVFSVRVHTVARTAS
jgi:hypothetical protein